MDFLDFFFPEQAQAGHLRKIADNSQQQALAMHRARFHQQMRRREDEGRVAALEQRIAQLERDMGQAGLVIEALLELLEESGTLNRQSVAQRTAEIDARDGTLDGRKTPPSKESGGPQTRQPDLRPRQG